MLRHVLWCRHPANSFINDLRIWYSPRKKNKKHVAVQVNFTDMVFYIEQAGLQSGGGERVYSVWCWTPLLYLRLQSWTHKSHSDFTDLVLQYLPFYSNTLYKMHLFHYLSPTSGLWHAKHFLGKYIVEAQLSPFLKSFTVFAAVICFNKCLNNDKAAAISGETMWK